MRPRSRLFSLLAAAFSAGACNLVFGIDGGTPALSGDTGGAHDDGGPPDAAPDHDGAGGGTPCVANTATCSNGVLEACDGAGQPEAPVTCPVVAACDAAAGACIPAATFGRLAVGTGHACAIEDDRSVRCWGTNGGGGLLMSDPHDLLPTAQPMPGVAGVRQISVGIDQQCALMNDGTIVCWGINDSGELGVAPGSTLGPTTVPGIAGAVEVSATAHCTCARLADGTVTCWGAEDTGCLGVPSPASIVRTPTQVPGVTGAVELRAGAYTTPSCARQASGKVLCWTPDITPSEIPGVSDAIDVAVGFGLVFVHSKQGGVLWSAPTSNQTWSAAVSYGLAGTITQIAAGDAFVALRDDGVVLYALLDGTSPPDPPAPLAGAPAGAVTEIAAGGSLSYDQGLQCLRLAGSPLSSGVYCWGDDAGGALGAGAPDLFRVATDVPNVESAASLTTSQTSTTIVLADGSAVLWGTAYALANDPVLAPQDVASLGGDNTIVRDNDVEQIAYVLQKSGAPSLVDDLVATPNARLLSTGLTDFVDARVWHHFDVGLRANGAVVVYADAADANTEGVFGDGTTTAVADEVVTVPGITTAQAIASYSDDYNPDPAHVCAILGPGGAVACWGGNNEGEIGAGVPGDGVTVTAPATVSIPNGEAIVSIAAGRYFTCAVSAAGTVYCWGLNDMGQLGSPGPEASPVPLAIMGIAGAVGVTAREAHACAWLAGGTVKCWGVNQSGQLGDGTLDDRDQPVDVMGLSGVVEVSAGVDHTCARRGDGSVACWGSSYDGEIGTGVVGVFPTPLQVLGL